MMTTYVSYYAHIPLSIESAYCCELNFNALNLSSIILFLWVFQLQRKYWEVKTASKSEFFTLVSVTPQQRNIGHSHILCPPLKLECYESKNGGLVYHRPHVQGIIIYTAPVSEAWCTLSGRQVELYVTHPQSSPPDQCLWTLYSALFATEQ